MQTLRTQALEIRMFAGSGSWNEFFLKGVPNKLSQLPQMISNIFPESEGTG